MRQMTLVPKSTEWARKNKDRVKERDQLRKGTLEGKLVGLITQSRYRARKSGMAHDIDVRFLRELYDKQQGKCKLSGLVMTMRGTYGSTEYWHSLSIDRIDSSGGYTKENTQLLCTGVNKVKGKMSDSQFLSFCKSVVENSHA